MTERETKIVYAALSSFLYDKDYLCDEESWEKAFNAANKKAKELDKQLKEKELIDA